MVTIHFILGIIIGVVLGIMGTLITNEVEDETKKWIK